MGTSQKRRATRRALEAVSPGAILEIEADCCTVWVAFTTTGGAIPTHERRCIEPDEAGVARVVAQALSDLHGVPVVAVY